MKHLQLLYSSQTADLNVVEHSNSKHLSCLKTLDNKIIQNITKDTGQNDKQNHANEVRNIIRQTSQTKGKYTEKMQTTWKQGFCSLFSSESPNFSHSLPKYYVSFLSVLTYKLALQFFQLVFKTVETQTQVKHLLQPTITMH